MAEVSDEFTPRAYQIDLYEQAMAENTIIYLPTGTGKTYVAVMLIKKMSLDVQKRYSEGGKRTVFVVNTVALVIQQSTYIQRHTGLSCQGYSGDSGVDYWTKADWLDQLEQFQVLVMTSQILLDILNHGYLPLDRINLIIFDECHRGVNNHPMRRIMQCFQYCAKEKQPRVLSLSATLLNSNMSRAKVEQTLQTLEITFQSRIATIESHSEIRSYSTNPVESIVKYDSYSPPPCITQFIEILEDANQILDVVSLTNELCINESSDVFKPKTKNAHLKCILDDTKIHILQTGIYGGNKAVLLHLTQLELLKKSCEDLHVQYIFEYLITKLTTLRRLLTLEMASYTESECIHGFSSDQVLKLTQILKNFKDRDQNNKFCAIIFVKRRFTAKVLYHILKNLRQSDETFSFLIPEFIVGFSNDPYKNSRETLCLSKWNKEALHKFQTGQCNCLIATDVVDEGIDIPTCTLIVRYDLPMDVRAYIQSKGRARHNTSEYILMVNNEEPGFLDRYKQFKDIEQVLVKSLIGKTDVRQHPRKEMIEANLYRTELKPLIVKDKDGKISVISDSSAIPIINRYCSSLYKSKFVRLVPIWILYELDNQEFQVSLQMPSVSPLKTKIIGSIMGSINDAKKAAALKTCIELYNIGELTDRLLPRDQRIVPQDLDYLFPNWRDEDKDVVKIAGTTKRKKRYELIYPQPLYKAYPVAGETVHLHIIRIKPTYSTPQDNRNFIFYNLLDDNAGYAIVSRKSLPKIPEFPIFMNVGQSNVEIKVNHSTMKLTSDQITSLKIFHITVFHRVLEITKPFMVFDNENYENNFLIAPTNGHDEIDWDIVSKYHLGNFVSPPTSFEFKKADYDLAVVTPNYRASPSVYIVTQVCDDLTPESVFPTEDFDSYAHYYRNRHGLSINDLKQPMLEVKPISTKIDCIKPRRVSAGLSKRKRADILQDLEEHLIPELCTRNNFPALYWLKATTLPSILHRLSQILSANELRCEIIRDIQLGRADLEPSRNWPPLKIESESENDQLSEASLETTLEDGEIMETDEILSQVMGPEIDVLNTEANLYPWKAEEEPTDLDRNLENIQLIDIEFFHHFTSVSIDQQLCPITQNPEYIDRPTVNVSTLKILAINNDIGPSPVDIMQGLTTKLGNDAFDLERLETLGDSFLKFFVTLYLFHTFPNFSEGNLTAIKGKMLGNRNLCYCGIKKKIPGRMKVDNFVPNSNFITPCFTVHRGLQAILRDGEISPSVLYEISIPFEERFNGYISEPTQNLMEEKVSNWESSEAATLMEHFIGQQTVADKVVADCIEALIGVYLQTMGVGAAAKLLKWFEIIPCITSIEEVLSGIPNDPEINPGNPTDYMPWADQLEHKLSYKFQNRCFLLQAFTHPSYTPNTMTECYQRLEFLGDALIDFLITTYIFENCGNLSPGDLTDLRSALVNNITFACLSVRYGLHTALLSYSPVLNTMIDRFVKFQEDRNHAVDDELLWILLEEEEHSMAEYVDVPKVLGDIFESLIGAIYLDSNKDISKVWGIVYSLMHKEIDAFSKNVPMQPIRVIYETPGASPQFLSIKQIDDPVSVMVCLKVWIAGEEKLFYGFGTNKKQAKCAAAKLALKTLRCKK